MKKHFIKFIAAILFVAVAALVVQSCDDRQPKSTTTTGATAIMCDESFENIMEQEIMVFENIYPKATIGCRYVSQREALDSLFAGNVQTIVVGRDLTKSEFSKLKTKHSSLRSMKVAVDAVALIINKDNPVNALSMKEIGEILSGETTNWSQIEPGAPDLKIQVVFDNPQSGLANFMKDSLLAGRQFAPTIASADSVQGVFEAVKTHRGAIGIIGVSWLTSDLKEDSDIESIIAAAKDTTIIDGAQINERMDNSGVKTIGVMKNDLTPRRPYQQNIYDGSYPLTRPMYIITTGSPKSLAGGFYSFITGREGQRLIMRTGIMPARMQINVYEVNRD